MPRPLPRAVLPGALLLALAVAPLTGVLASSSASAQEVAGPEVVAVGDAGADVPEVPDVPDVVVEPVPDVPLAVRRQGVLDSAASAAATTAPAGLPSLHSRPGATRTILLDFDGHVVTGSQWTRNQGLPSPYVAKPWSMDADPAFSTVEAARVRETWAVVAEDFAPFDVDVTTVDPGDAGLERTSPADQTYGVRALMSDSDAWQQVCQGVRCGGVAYIGVFADLAASVFSPAWVFPQNFADDARTMGDAISHEVGHTLGLSHDGTTSPRTEYFSGQGVWAPIMGTSGAKPLMQWSNGDYTAASNQQDDVAQIVAGGAPLVADDAGDTPADAVAGLPRTGLISTRTDVDWYRLSRCTGVVNIAAAPAVSAPDLDIVLELRDAAGGLLDRDDPVSTRLSQATRLLTGLDALVSAQAPLADYLVKVDGVGSGSPLAGGYSDYGSIGPYTLALGGTCQAVAGLASPPRDVAATSSGTTATVTWSEPATTGGSAITGYRVTAWPGGAVVATDAGARSATFTGLARATAWTFSVVATNAAGNSGATQVGASTPASPPSAVATMDLTGSGSQAVVTWTAPDDDGGSPVTGYRVRIGSLDQTYAADVGQLTVTGLRGDVTAWVVAVNAAGEGTPSTRTLSLGGAAPTTPAGTGPTTGSVAGAPLVVLTRPSVTGTGRVGRALRARPGAWSRPATLAYRWTSGSTVLGRAATYRPTRALAGRRLVLQVTATTAGSAPVVVTVRTPKITR